MTSSKTLWMALVAVAILAIGVGLGSYLLPHLSHNAGAVPTQDITSTRFTQLTVDNGIFNTQGCQSNAGVTTCTVRQSLVSGTSTPCAIANPIVGTSTLTNFQMNITTATSSAITWAIGTSTTAFATSTTLLTPTVGASTQTTQSYRGGSGNTLSSGNFVVAGAGAGTAPGTGAFGTGIVVAGTCQATFQSAF